MSNPRVEITRTETTTGTLKVSVLDLVLGFAEMVKKYDIPASAQVEVEIPGGGDWAGTRLDAREIDAVITWEVSRDVE